MATSTISADVKSANSKIAQMLRKREEDEMLLQIGKRKPKAQTREDNKRLPGARAKWNLEPDFTYPTPMVDRPRTNTGSTSFHFSYISISKQAAPTLNGKSFSGAFAPRQAPGLEHSKYIERDGASEHAAYIEREGAVETVDPSNMISESIERTISDVINETPTENEAQMLGVEEDVVGIRSLFTNISDDPFEREQYWAAVHRSERDPKMHNIVLVAGENEAWWNALPTAQMLDPAFKQHALHVAARYREHVALEEASPEPLPPFRADPFQCTQEQAGRVIQTASGMPGFDTFRPPFRFESGRGGRVQIRFVAELPHELSAQDRALIAQNFCDHLGSFSKDATGKPTGMMYTAVIHAPDAHNDRRNYHLHIVAHDRPAVFRADDGMWDFEVEQPYNHKGEIRIRFPHRQNKIGEVSQPGHRTQRENSGKDFIPAMRAEFAKITNTVLAARRIERRIDPRKYTEMGIDRTPTDHLGTKAAALESIGVPTAVGKLNAIAIWSDAERSIQKNLKATDKALRDEQKALVDLGRSAVTSVPDRQVLQPLLTLTDERSRLIANVAEDRSLVMTFDHMEAKVKSRAIRTRQTCIQYLSDIEAGRMPGATKSLTKLIRERFANAQAHIEKIDKMLESDRPKLAAAAADIERREERIKAIDTLLAPIKETVSRLVGVNVAKAPATTVGDPNKSAQASSPLGAPNAVGAAAPTAGPPAPPIAAAPSAGVPVPPEQSPVSEPTGVVRDPDAKLNEQAVTEPKQSIKPAAPVPPPLAPITMDGHDIVQPTINPTSSPLVQPDPNEPLPTPKGLEPLRAPEAVEPTAPVDAAPVSLDMPVSGPSEALPAPNAPSVSDGTGRVLEPSNEPDADDKKTGLDTPALPVPPTPEAFVPPAAIEPKIDRRKKVGDPTLFPVVEQTAPIKSGTTAAEYEAWDLLLNRISRERIPVQVAKAKDGSNIFSVSALGADDLVLLNTKRLAKRTNNRLGAFKEHQDREVGRLIAWIRQKGNDPANLELNAETRRAVLLNAPASVVTLWKHWRTHERVREVLIAESERRIEVAKAQTVVPKTPTQPFSRREEVARQDRMARAERFFPPAEKMQSREVAAFITLAKEGASRAELQTAADAIAANNFAREQVFRFGDQLAAVYNEMVNDAQLRLLRELEAQKERGRI